MPSGHPKDPEAYRAKLKATREANSAKKLAQKQSDEALVALREKLTGGSPKKDDSVSYANQIENLYQRLESQMRINDNLHEDHREKIAIAERRLMTVLDLVAMTRVTTT